MRGIKPFKLGFIARPFQWGRQHHLGVSVMAFFGFDPPGVVYTDIEMWDLIGQELADTAFDVGMPKSRGEVVVTGRCFVPGGAPAATCPVRVKVGDVEKTIYVIGDRVWQKGVPTKPAPFTEMPIHPAHAFGGPSFARNPLGKGAAPLEDDSGRPVHPLPNLELPGAMITSPKDTPEPAIFGPLDFAWPQRFAHAGTYGRAWLEERYPGFAEDMDWRIWNVAPPDQWTAEAWRGDELIEVDNMHPEKPKLRARLPSLRGRAFIGRRGGDGTIEEVALRATTVWLFPARERGIVLFQGAAPVEEDDAKDIEAIMIAAERLSQPRELGHYQRVFAQRTGPEAADNPAFHLLDEELVPTEHTGFSPEVEEHMKLVSPQGFKADLLRVRADREIAEARRELAEAGLDPDEHGPKPLPPPEPQPPPEDLVKVAAWAADALEKAKADVEQRKQEGLASVVELYERLGLDADEVKRELDDTHRGPPEFSADATRARMKALYDETEAAGHPVEELRFYATDDEYYAGLTATERTLLETYRGGAHLQRPAFVLEGEAAARVRQAVAEGIAAGESFAERDLTGADLRGQLLERGDFRRALMESANLTGAILDDAALPNAVLAHADLTGARLRRADLTSANLGGARLIDADLSDARCDGANLMGATLTGALLGGASLDEAVFQDTDMSRADLSGVQLAKCAFLNTRLAGARCVGANLQAAVFVEVDLSGVDFGGANLDAATFVGCKLDRASFVGASMQTVRCIGGVSTWLGADFRGANLKGANLRGLVLRGSDFTGACLDGADLSESDLDEARLYRVVARGSSFVRTSLRSAFLVSANLMNALLQKADLRGADLRGANLYAADMALIRADADTNVTDAITLKVRSLPRRVEP